MGQAIWKRALWTWRWAACGLVLGALGCGESVPPGPSPMELGQVEQTVCANGPTVEGIDVSRYQGTINWSQVKTSGKAFALIQAGRGLSADPQFAANWAGAKAQGLLRGTYLRFFPSEDVTAQAELLIQANLQVGATQGDLPPMLDIEDDDGLSPAALRTRIQALVQQVQAGTGRIPLLYTGYYFWKDSVQSPDYGALPLVIANYSNPCPPIPAGWSRWTFHQYSSTGKVPGISGNVDLDRFNGTLAELQAFARAVPPMNPASEGVLTGAVYEQDDSKRRLAGATVRVEGTLLQAVTGTDGLFRFTLAPGTYTATVEKAGYLSSEVVRTVLAGKVVWGSIGLEPTVALAAPDAGANSTPTAGPGLSGFCLRASDGVRLPGVHLSLQATPDTPEPTEGAANPEVATTVSDAEGAFDLPLANTPFEGTLTARAEGYPSRTWPVLVEGPGRTVMDVELTPLPSPPEPPASGEEPPASPPAEATAGCTAVPASAPGALALLLVGRLLTFRRASKSPAGRRRERRREHRAAGKQGASLPRCPREYMLNGPLL